MVSLETGTVRTVLEGYTSARYVSSGHLIVRDSGTQNLLIYLESSESVDAVEILDARGELVRRLSIDGLETGLNRLRWDLRYPGATVFDGMVLESPSPRRGPWAPPGTYRARVKTSRHTTTETFEILKDPRLERVSLADLEEQFRLASHVRDRTSEANEAVIAIRALKLRLHASGAPPSIAERLTAVEAKLYQIKNQSPKDKIASRSISTTG